MPSIRPLTRRRGVAAVAVGILAAAVSATTTLTPASAQGPDDAASTAHVTSVKVHRGGRDATIGFHRGRAGEVFLDATVSARGVSWADHGNESAVVSAYVDGHYATDIVVASAGPVAREFALGSLRAGHHTLRLHYAAGRSRSDAGVAKLQDLAFRTVARTSPAYVAARYAPVLYGRDVAGLGGRFQNNRTDTPLVAWHQVLPTATPGRSMIEYSVIWSNEDGGTNSAGLMAKWGRTTDIEWIYRVVVDAKGRRVGSGVFQSPNHGTEKFRGPFDGTHPLLQTCTNNNNVCDARALKRLKQARDPMRFALSARDVLPKGQPREHEMDLHPWTYQVMAKEMLREHKIESPSDPTTLAVGDQRSYLYLTLDHVTDPASDAAQVGLAVDVTLNGDKTIYSSDHDNPLLLLFTINRDGAAATTVELPRGTTADDVKDISVRRVPLPPPAVDSGASLTVTGLGRAFFLGSNYLPRPSFAHVTGSSIVLDLATPTAPIWPPTP